MKKKLLIVIAVCLVLALVLALAACGESGNNDNKGNNTQTNTDNNQSGNAGDNTQPGGNTTQPGNGGQDTQPGEGGNQGGVEGGDETLQTVVLASVESVVAAFGDTYKVSASAPDGGAVTTVASEGTYYYASSPMVVFQKRIGDFYYTYTDLREGKYHRMGTPNYYPDEAIPTFLTRGNVGGMMQFAGETHSYNTVENVTFLGRAAKKYTREGANLYGYDMLFHEEIVVDDVTGACLKCDWYGRAGAGFTGSTYDKVSFEVTELEYGANNAAALALIDSEKEKIDVYPWDTAFMSRVGLSTVAAIDENNLFTSYWDYGSTRNSENADWEVQYHLHGATAQENEAVVKAIRRAFYDAGACLNYEGENQTYDNFIWEDEDDSNGFTGYVGDYCVEIYNDFISSAANPYWRVVIRIYKPDRT